MAFRSVQKRYSEQCIGAHIMYQHKSSKPTSRSVTFNQAKPFEWTKTFETNQTSERWTSKKKCLCQLKNVCEFNKVFVLFSFVNVYLHCCNYAIHKYVSKCIVWKNQKNRIRNFYALVDKWMLYHNTWMPLKLNHQLVLTFCFDRQQHWLFCCAIHSRDKYNFSR